MIPPGLPALHFGRALGSAARAQARWSGARARAAPRRSWRAPMRVAPVTGRIARFSRELAVEGLPWNCSYQCGAREVFLGLGEGEHLDARDRARRVDLDHDRLGHRAHDVRVEVGGPECGRPSSRRSRLTSAPGSSSSPESFCAAFCCAAVRYAILRSIVAPGNASFNASSCVRKTFASSAAAASATAAAARSRRMLRKRTRARR